MQLPSPLAKPVLAVACAVVCVALGACGTAVSTSSFSGEEREVAQEISNFQSHVSAADQAKICSSDLSSELVGRLHAAPGGCKAVIKEQLGEVDSATLTIHSIQLGGSPAQRTARASVKSTYAGKTRTSTLLLVKQNGAWRVAGVA
jgi:hypothetical protein